MWCQMATDKRGKERNFAYISSVMLEGGSMARVRTEINRERDGGGGERKGNELFGFVKGWGGQIGKGKKR